MSGASGARPPLAASASVNSCLLFDIYDLKYSHLLFVKNEYSSYKLINVIFVYRQLLYHLEKILSLLWKYTSQLSSFV